MPDQPLLCPLCEASSTGAVSVKLRIHGCAACGLRFRHPQPSDAELQRIYDAAYADERVAEGSEDMAGTTDDIARQYVAQLLRFEPVVGRRVVDFGAGLGSMSRALAAAGAEVFAVDAFSADHLAQQGLRAFRSPEELAGLAPFDGCVAMEVIEHLRHPWALLEQLRALTKPGGFLFVTTPNAEGLKPRLALDGWSEALDEAHLFLFSPRSLETALRRSGNQKLQRLRTAVRYSQNPLVNAARAGLQVSGLDGQLRYLAWS
ncbi:MAG: methyltransferase domain-containing protein [Acidobacteria bacterium]|nr:methyltransferase domain-containing protein [Acidobacteriota bacterium]